MMNDSIISSHAGKIAIIGMACRFPGASNVDQFWENLRKGVESIDFPTDEELLSLGVPPSWLAAPNYVGARAVPFDLECFDASFFGYSPREAEVMDPQHRLFLECSWEALESAGYNSFEYGGPIGVFAGANLNTYLLNNLWPNHSLVKAIGGFQLSIGNDKDYLNTRVSYKLNLRGPSVNVQTACSTSLVAVHLAIQSLLNGECDIALAGGAGISGQNLGYFYERGGILSADGHCKAFDAGADGTVHGNGVGIVVLKRLHEALVDRDSIHAVITGSAINNDGAGKIGFTAPSVQGQAAVIAEAQAIAGVEPESISYVEAHGTATRLGDPIEINALNRVFRAQTQRKQFCAIGSVKTNFGHLGAAAGVASLIKTVLALKYKLLPPSLHFHAPNPEIDFASGPFFVNTQPLEWDSEEPRRAGISSFGIGGTNAHVIVEEAPAVKRSGPEWPYQLITLSARTEADLNWVTENLAHYLDQHREIKLADAAYTLQVGRKTFIHRRAVVATHRGIASMSNDLNPSRSPSAVHAEGERPVAFMFPGGGAQYPNMALELYKGARVVREAIDSCADLLSSHLRVDLREILYPEEARSAEALHQLSRPSFALPALFATEYALAQLWMSWGVTPAAMIGHSLGEYMAACLADVFSLEDALAVVAMRGRLFERMPAGAMASIPLSANDLQPYLSEGLSLAATNSPMLSVLSGQKQAVEELETTLRRKGLDIRRLSLLVAAHSQLVEEILPEFASLLQDIRLSPPRIPYISNVTGTWIKSSEATSPSYWVRHLRQTVRFADGIRLLTLQRNLALLEVGPGRTLSTFAQLSRDREPNEPLLTFTSIVPRQESDSEFASLLTTLGRMWSVGVGVDWHRFYEDQERHRVPLPTYPFERQRLWVECNPNNNNELPTRIERKQNLAEWFYLPSWRSSLPPHLPLEKNATQKFSFLIFADSDGLAADLAQRLMGLSHEVIAVNIGNQYEHSGHNLFSLRPNSRGDYDRLMEALVSSNRVPTKLVHLWTVSNNDLDCSGRAAFPRCQQLGFYSLVFLAQAIEASKVSRPLELFVVSTHLQATNGEEVFSPEKRALLAPCIVIPQELRNIGCVSIDVSPSLNGTRERAKIVDQVLAEVIGHPAEPIVAYRGNQRLVRTYEPVRLEEDLDGKALRHNGVYLITGGLGRIGLLLGEYLAKTLQAKIILVGRSPFPNRNEWSPWLKDHEHDGDGDGDGDRVSQALRAIARWEEFGAEVMVISADVANDRAMEDVLGSIHQRFGHLNGVFHAAGITRGDSVPCSITRVGTKESEEQFHAKVTGLYALERLLSGKPIDFCLLFSSNAAILGGLGLVAYSASNIFMDGFAAARNKSSHFPWISVNWDGWLVEGLEPRKGASMRSSLDEFVLTPNESLEALRRILLAASVDQVIVSAGDLRARLNLWTGSHALPIEEPEAGGTSLYARPPLADKFVGPRNEVEGAICRIWQELLGIRQVGVHDNFFELGGHSLLATQVMSRLADSLGETLPASVLAECPTVAELARVLANVSVDKHGREQGPAKSSLVKIRQGNGQRKLFFVHPQGGGVLCYYDLAVSLGSDSHAFYGLEEPYLLGTADKPFTNIGSMAAHYLESARAHQPNGPYFLGGWSMGGLVAFEMACQLERLKERVSLLVMIDSPAPLGSSRPLVEDSELLAMFILNLARRLGKELPLSYHDLRGLTVAQQLDCLLSQLSDKDRLLLATNPQVHGLFDKTVSAHQSHDDRDAISRLIHVAKAHAIAVRDYEPGICRAEKIVMFRAEDPGPKYDPLREHSHFSDPDFGWKQLCGTPIITVNSPGDHNTLIYKPHVKVLAELLSRSLEATA